MVIPEVVTQLAPSGQVPHPVDGESLPRAANNLLESQTFKILKVFSHLSS